MCLYPTLIKNRKYTSNTKNGGIIPPVLDERTLYVPIGCQDCIECRRQKARNWKIRLLEDIKQHKDAKFVTLTFSNEAILKLIQESKTRSAKSKAKRPIIDLTQLEGYQLDNELAITATRLFLERWRKKYKKSLRHFLITELGHNGTENIHLHGLLWTKENRDTIEQIWNYGWIYPRNKEEDKKAYVSVQTINYIIKYITKQDTEHKLYKSQILTSSGIGANYLKSYNATRNKYKEQDTIQTYRTETGDKIPLPIYYRNKIYTDEEKEQLWIATLNKEERWVCGEKADVSKTDKEYNGLIKHYRKINQQLGYGNGQKTWNQEIYERERRRIKYATRLAQARKNILQ